MFAARAILMVLIAARLMMPPGICVCQWKPPAARCLAALLQEDRQIPNEEERDDDDHAPGCPASPLAAGMGIQPSAAPLFPPDLALDLPPLPSPPSLPTLAAGAVLHPHFDALQDPLYLTFRALLI